MSPIGIFLLLCLTAPLTAQGRRTSSDEEPPSLVEVEAVTSEDVSTTSQFVATVVPTRRSVIGTAVDGRVDSFLLDPDRPDRKLTQVREGQVLAQLRTDTIKRELAVARAELTLREHQLAELNNGSRPEEIVVAQAELTRWKASLEFSRSRYKRLTKIYEANNSISLDELEASRVAVTQAEQSHLEAKAKYDLVIAGPRVEQIAQAEARAEAQRQTVMMLEEMVSKYTVRAPFDGYVVAEMTDVGAWVSRGDPVAEVIQLVPMEVEAHVPQKHIHNVAIGESAEIRLTVMPHRALKGRVERIIPQADVRSRTFPVRIRLDKSIKPESHGIMAGMLGHVVLSLRDAPSVMLVSKDAIVLDGDRQSVVVVVPFDKPTKSGAMGKARLVKVSLGISRDSLIEISGEVKVGDLVVTRGNERLRMNQPLVWKQRTF